MDLPQNLLELGAIVSVLGIKHGFDADHLATIDGLTRFNSRANPPLSRYCGMLFSLGHGAVVIIISLVVSTIASQWQVPSWLEMFGAWVSIVFLAALGVLNLHAVRSAHPAQMVKPVRFKGRLLGKLARAASPGLVALVGALFAISFDTISQAALFSLTASQFGGWQNALMMGLLFMLGMLLTDGLNGFWISRLLSRADRVALFASRAMGLVVAGLSLLVAAFGMLRIISPAIDLWSEGKNVIFGIFVIAVVAASFAIAVRVAKGEVPAGSDRYL